ncbi:PAS domain-containing sensor histidine kinase [Paenibacillus koleovorans]|uniref:PAS domain-containing sensor histidine kinase n=1 Tax=Paenibacillus koleovorans TaxID=121608 RepID=UPI000FDC0447|nr:PAS domain-containing sensor histidine kinase [Paenibacillus koleovorans]
MFTQRLLGEEAYHVRTVQLLSVIEHNADAIWLIDAADTVIDVNPAFETLFGWSAEDIIGSRLPMIPDYLKADMDELHRRIRTGETVVGMETIRERKDGKWIEVEATLSPIRDQTGMIIGITGICRDITAKKHAQHDLQMRTMQLESFIDNNADAILICNDQFIVERVNHAFEMIFGWSQEEIVGLNIHSVPFVPADVMAESRQLSERLRNGETLRGVETVRLRKNGEGLNVMVSATPILNTRGGNHAWSVTYQDITNWKLAQEHMKNSEKLSVAGQLAAGIAHEIRNPITSIKGFIQLMRSGYGEKQKYFDIMTSEIERIELILSELLLLAKPQLIKYEPKDIRVLLSQVLALLDSQANLKNIQFVTEYKPGVSHLYCDENQIKQVFINFIKNAMESMADGGMIRIQIQSLSEQDILIRIVDDGCGIPKDILAKLGQPFMTTKQNGTGLGFMVSKTIIENHSGQIKVSSVEGVGTTIEITLPIYTDLALLVG